ncbi:MAG: ATP-grasp domain-containing protein [Melioribacteraceae bacterium]|nr:ATP-grasp domain-containing protein [Melioribacteraceae bacterium]MCF8353495.1 ATP-grasp domain-containing protein [Melioribacteraceae bacterium]MCF8392624.1 ATP-grasp domain-containing protein [Melioribacteraceae bacterium]MCF8418504.1 ATP-grasp domain-containing protein [Melioribacteraceae bacterium]
MNQDKKILVCYNEPVSIYDNYTGKAPGESAPKIDLSENDFMNHLEGIIQSLRKQFSNVGSLAFNDRVSSIVNKIYEENPDVIFNFIEAIEGNSNFEFCIPGLFDILGIQYTGNNATTLGNCLFKERTKHILKAHGINTSRFLIFEYKKKPEEKMDLNFPVIVKLAKEDASIGISELSVVHDKQSLNQRINFLFKNFSQDIIVEEYIIGREFNVSILGNEILPISEISYRGLPKGYPKIVTYEAKWAPDSVYYNNTNPVCPADINDTLRRRIENAAIDSYHALECRDYARVDIRLKKNSIPYVIEVNPNPDLSSDAGFANSASAAGISYDELLARIAGYAINRQINDKKAAG